MQKIQEGQTGPFRFKILCLCSLNEYSLEIDIYTGKSSENKTKTLDLRIGSHVMTKLLTVIEVPSNHLKYFDNFFTSNSLLTELTSMQLTVRDNRIGKYPLQSVKEIKVEARGTYHPVFVKKNDICVKR